MGRSRAEPVFRPPGTGLVGVVLLSLSLVLPSCVLCARTRRSHENERGEDMGELLRREMKEKEARIEALKADTIPLLDELRELPAGYWGKGAEERFERRKSLRAEIQAKKTAVETLKKEYGEVMKEHEALYMGVAHDVLTMGTTDLPGLVGTGILLYVGPRNYNRAINNYTERVDAALAAEGSSYRAARKAREERRLWTWAGIAAVLLFGGVYLVVRRASLPARVVVEGCDPVRLLGESYRLDNEIFKDRLGVAYKATHLKSKDARTAWIMLRDSGLSVKEAAARARQAAGISHPGLSSIREVLSEEGRFCLISDPEEGEGLDTLLVEAGRFPMGRVVEVLEKVGQVLDHLHGSGAVHGGLRLADMRLLADGRVKVGGFGVPRSEDPAFSAPERMFTGTVPASDLFSLAVCGYRAITGGLPFAGPDYPEQKRKMEFIPPSQALAGLPKGTDEIFRQALHPDPSQRQRSCGEFSMALRAAWVRSRRKA